MKKASSLPRYFTFPAILFFLQLVVIQSTIAESRKQFVIDENTSYYITNYTWETAPTGGDTIFILAERTNALKFQHINGNPNNPVVVINSGGQVKINASSWGAVTFENCKNIKITGSGHPGFKYGFLLAANSCGLAFSELSSDCEAEFVHVNHDGFFGIMAKKDYGGNPPKPAPVFANLKIHDCFVENVTEGMYLGETKSPGMEFRHVKIYNNIVRNTGREAIQVANMVEDVEIFNNTLLNTGLNGELYQTNILQIGDNSVCNVYNNILIGAEGFGVISMGSGNNIFTNNYIASNSGMFIDNRKITDINAEIEINGNYFHNISGSSVIKNMNEVNQLVIKKNSWDNNIDFFENVSGNKKNYKLIGNSNNTIEAISFVNPDKYNYALAESTLIEYLQMGAPGGPIYSDYNEPTPDPEPQPEPEPAKQIVLTADMIIDLVDGGSYHSPEYLVDEQSMTPENDLHPVSESWKPHWNMDKAPYHFYIDLGEDYNLTNISLHDMHNTQNLDIYVGEPGNWKHLFTESCGSYKTWKQHSVDVTSRYIRLSMNESVYAAVNEIIVHGASVSARSEQKSVQFSSSLKTSAQNIQLYQPKLKLYPNPAINNIKVKLPQEIQNDFVVQIFDASGQIVYSQNSQTSYQSELSIDLTNGHFSNGTYYLRYSSEKGSSRTAKFVKQGS